MIILLERMRTRKDLEPLFHNLEGIIFLPSLGTPPQRLGSSLVIFLFEDEGDEPKGELTTSSSVINVINDLDAYLDEACDLMDKEDRIKFEIWGSPIFLVWTLSLLEDVSTFQMKGSWHVFNKYMDRKSNIMLEYQYRSSRSVVFCSRVLVINNCNNI